MLRPKTNSAAVRIRDLGAATVQAAALVGTVGLLGVGFYGYHNSNTGVAIQSLVPEWQVQPSSIQVASAPQCTQPPAATEMSHALPAVRVEYKIPFSDEPCEAWFGSGDIKVRVEASGKIDESVSADCERKGGGQLNVSLGVQVCPFIATVRSRGHGSHWERLCKRCSNPPRESCSGSKCSIDGYNGEGTVSGGYEWTRATPPLFGVEGKLKFRLEVGGGVTYRKSAQTSGNACGRCPEPDCKTETVGLYLGDSVATVGGEAKIGPFKAQAEGQCRFQPNVSVTQKSDSCTAPTGLCSSGSITLRCGIVFRSLADTGGLSPGTTTGGNVWNWGCRGTWGINSCGSQGGVPNVPWACKQENVTDLF